MLPTTDSYSLSGCGGKESPARFERDGTVLYNRWSTNMLVNARVTSSQHTNAAQGTYSSAELRHSNMPGDWIHSSWTAGSQLPEGFAQATVDSIDDLWSTILNSVKGRRIRTGELNQPAIASATCTVCSHNFKDASCCSMITLNPLHVETYTHSMRILNVTRASDHASPHAHQLHTRARVHAARVCLLHTCM